MQNNISKEEFAADQVTFQKLLVQSALPSASIPEVEPQNSALNDALEDIPKQQDIGDRYELRITSFQPPSWYPVITLNLESPQCAVSSTQDFDVIKKMDFYKNTAKRLRAMGFNPRKQWIAELTCQPDLIDQEFGHHIDSLKKAIIDINALQSIYSSFNRKETLSRFWLESKINREYKQIMSQIWHQVPPERNTGILPALRSYVDALFNSQLSGHLPIQSNMRTFLEASLESDFWKNYNTRLKPLV